MDIIILIVAIVLIALLAFPFTKFIKRWSTFEDKLIRNTFQKVFTDEEKAKIAYWVFRVIVIILIILLSIFLNSMIRKETQQAVTPKQDNFQGFGGENTNPPTGGSKPTEEEIAEDAKLITPSQDGIKSLYPINADPTIQLLEDPRRYKYFTANDEKYVELLVGKTVEEFQLKTSDGKISEFSVSDGMWDATEQYFLFTKAERLDTGFVNKNNIWIFKFGETQTKEIFSTDDYNSLVYISNGEKIAFATKNRVGIMNLDGSDVKYIYDFQEFNSRSDDLYVPVITVIDRNTFSVNIKLPTYFVDGAEDIVKFKFSGVKI